MTLLSNFKKNRAIKSYIYKLPSTLARLYGKSQKYTPEQISEASKHLELNMNYIGYALAIFSTQTNFSSYAGKAGLRVKYSHLRTEVADKYFGGQSDLKIIFPKINLYRGNADRDLKSYYFRNH